MKRSQSDSQVLANLLVMLPPWVTALLGVVAYFVIQWLPNVVTGMYHEGLIKAGPFLGKIALFVFGLAALLGWVKRWLDRPSPKKGSTPPPIGAGKLDSKVSSAPSTPFCPSCGSTMTMRTAKKGVRAGKSFWGCSTYPSCSYTHDL